MAGPKSPGGRWLRHGSLESCPQGPPSWLCHRASPLPALWETVGSLRSLSQHHLVFSSLLAVSSPLPPSPVQTPLSNAFPFSEGTRGGGGAGVSLSLSSAKGAALVSAGRVGANGCPTAAPGGGKSPGCKAGGENAPGLSSRALHVAIYGCTFCSKPDARHCKRESEQPAASQRPPGGRGEGRTFTKRVNNNNTGQSLAKQSSCYGGSCRSAQHRGSPSSRQPGRSGSCCARRAPAPGEGPASPGRRTPCRGSAPQV